MDFSFHEKYLIFVLRKHVLFGSSLPLHFLWHNAVIYDDAGTQTCWLEIQSCPWWTFSNTLSSLFRFHEDLDTLLTQSNSWLFRANLVSVKLHHKKWEGF